MTARHLFAYQAAWYCFSFAMIVVISLLQRRRWLRQADRLARQSDIVLPLWIEDRVARFLRSEFLYTWFVILLTGPLVGFLMVVTMTSGNSTKWLPWILVSFPLYIIAVGSVASLLPRWKASSQYRVTHLDSMSARDAFTPAEFAAVVIGAVLGLALSAWALWHVGAPATWWLAFAAAFIVAFAAWRRAAWGIMNRPSRASDEIELGWDDLLRFRQVRVLTAGAAWGPTFLVYVLDLIMATTVIQNVNGHTEGEAQVQWWPILLPIVTLLLLRRLFRRGRYRWRRAWLDPGGLG
jgi:hypothetical protein